MLLQEGRPVAYVSHALAYTETRYGQIEKELLAVVFALERFHQYTYGKTVDVEYDHKPLEAITQKALSGLWSDSTLTVLPHVYWRGGGGQKKL